ncbi:hypothetical protein K458DRAFT_71654 [Lentithecium fluviatile CBS 122367]|uniref:Uncharacterized protein n=1 Tax=Lentithecium fluviatile CBS 122367 TaxID=1168545 RepID=A0A6G1IVV1_9PLEO|nr:hypothetical protein K458DRAFT_71654 [Lentithecium fluviatile CBS 122367]
MRFCLLGDYHRLPESSLPRKIQACFAIRPPNCISKPKSYSSLLGFLSSVHDFPKRPSWHRDNSCRSGQATGAASPPLRSAKISICFSFGAFRELLRRPPHTIPCPPAHRETRGTKHWTLSLVRCRRSSNLNRQRSTTALSSRTLPARLHPVMALALRELSHPVAGLMHNCWSRQLQTPPVAG